MKFKKIMFTSMAVASTVSLPVALVSTLNKSDSRVIAPISVKASDAQQTLDAAASTRFGSTSQLIKAPENFRELEKLHPAESTTASTEWTPTYKPVDYSKIFDQELEYYHARDYGWHSIESFENYLRARLEIAGSDAERTFASFQEHEWLAWHHAAGGTLSASYIDGVTSPVRPTWEQAELHQPIGSEINNSIPWYLYDRGAKIFAFDNNNLENAFKRMKWLNRVVPTSFSEIGNESDINKVSRNYYMVNGQLVNKLDPEQDYFYVKDNESDFIRDQNGWKVIISPDLLQDKPGESKWEQLFDMVINPHAKGVAVGKSSKIVGTVDAGFDVKTPVEKQAFLESKRASHKIDINAFKEIDYPSDYKANVEYAFAGINSSSPATDGSKISASDRNWSGLYRLARKSSSFAQMAKDPNTYLPQEIMENSNLIIDPYANQQARSYTHPWNGGGYNNLWVEDGKGGHKVWKNLHRLEKRAADGTVTYYGLSLESKAMQADNSIMFYGNFMHVFPGNNEGHTWYKDLKDEWERFGY